MTEAPQLEDIRKAAERLRGVIHPSPLVRSGYLTRLMGSEVFLKLENLQETGAFKVRGAYNRLSRLSPKERQRGIVAASAGNHAQGVAWAAARMGLHATLIMPEDVSIRKLLAVREYGAQVVLTGSNYNDASAHAVELAGEQGQVLIPAFDDPDVIAGQGTIGLELGDMLDRDTALLVPVGGGGLISGIALAARGICPGVRIIGVQTESCPSTALSLEKNAPRTVEMGSTLADGIAVNRPGDLTFPLMRRYVDDMVCVEEEGIAGAILTLMDKANVIAEGAGAVPLAALMDGRLSTGAKRYILIISGGNIELNTVDRILERGAVKMGRLIRIEVNLLDIPGSLRRLLDIIADEKANILHIFHDRLDLKNPINVSSVVLNLETRGHDHGREVVERLKEAGYRVKQAF
ncbi:MAG: threonine ammonia-lyase [Deltaproteobacteria bacterium]|nr:threonine ammonia-lyase [Deltaproteobacteria bacterium]MBW2050267.1 threonine ammonia-lyase [Deltaproteobacteria bacterium]MBW2112928.1 threonine ammonia-lyase [Deltaproteobacteria bacterium]MBW2354001.1 threonine ammonia-lyase [Deltaproteobacteria bacterium]HDZ91874.1 threonine ammonia-lyase [Deltaproteobacteria bacterium]